MLTAMDFQRKQVFTSEKVLKCPNIALVRVSTRNLETVCFAKFCWNNDCLQHILPHWFEMLLLTTDMIRYEQQKHNHCKERKKKHLSKLNTASVLCKAAHSNLSA